MIPIHRTLHPGRLTACASLKYEPGRRKATLRQSRGIGCDACHEFQRPRWTQNIGHWAMERVRKFFPLRRREHRNCSHAAINFERIMLGARLALPPSRVYVIGRNTFPYIAIAQATEVSMALQL